ncbi:hypothetical protein TomTYG45_09550 [Sphingobium sp. TomTYG45]
MIAGHLAVEPRRALMSGELFEWPDRQGLDANRQASALLPFIAFGVSQMVLADDPTAVSLAVGRTNQTPHGLEPTDMHLCCALGYRPVLREMEVDTVSALMLGSDFSHRAIDIAYLDRCRRQADDAARSNSLLVLADIGIVAVAINAVEDQIAPVAMLVGQASGDDPAGDRLALSGIVQGMVVGRTMDACFPKLPVQRPDNVAALAHAPQRGLQFTVERPATVPAFLGQAEPGQRA